MSLRPKSKGSTSAGEIGQLQFNEESYAQRNVSTGGVYDIIGAAATAVRVGYYAALMVANPTASPLWIAIGDSSVGAPTGITNGYMIPPNGNLFISTGTLGEYVRCSASSTGVYKLRDRVVPQDDANRVS